MRDFVQVCTSPPPPCFRGAKGGNFLEQLDKNEVGMLFMRIRTNDLAQFMYDLDSFVARNVQSAGFFKFINGVLTTCVEVATWGLALVARAFMDNPDFAVLHVVLMLQIEIANSTRISESDRSFWSNYVDAKAKEVVERCGKLLQTATSQAVLSLYPFSLPGRMMKVAGQAMGQTYLPLYKTMFEQLADQTVVLPEIPSSWCNNINIHPVCVHAMETKISCTVEEGKWTPDAVHVAAWTALTAGGMLLADSMFSDAQRDPYVIDAIESEAVREYEQDGGWDLAKLWDEPSTAQREAMARDDDVWWNPFDTLGDWFRDHHIGL